MCYNIKKEQIMTNSTTIILEKYGFQPYANGDELNYKNQPYYYDTKMIVQGSHTDDYAYIICADEEEIKGFCYASSLIEHLMTDFDNHNIEKILKEMSKYTGIYLELYCNGNVPLVVNKCDVNALDERSLKSRMSNMLKAVGILDYLLQKRLTSLRKKIKT